MSRHDPLARPEEAIRRVYAYVAYRIGDGPAAEDVTSETIERALRYRTTYDPRKGSPGAWLVGIASRVIADDVVKRGREVATTQEGLEALERPDAADLSGLVAAGADLRAAMMQLDERSRDLLALRYGADLKAKEIAELLGMKTNAVEVALHRALGRLRAAMAGEAVSEPAPDLGAALSEPAA